MVLGKFIFLPPVTNCKADPPWCGINVLTSKFLIGENN